MSSCDHKFFESMKCLKCGWAEPITYSRVMSGKEAARFAEGAWRGKPIKEMTRKELVDAFWEMGALYQQALDQRRKDLV